VFFARLYGMPTAEAKHRSGEVLEVTGLADRAGDQAKTYSGAMKRRLNIGIGRLHRPKLLILCLGSAGGGRPPAGRSPQEPACRRAGGGPCAPAAPPAVAAAACHAAAGWPCPPADRADVRRLISQRARIRGHLWRASQRGHGRPAGPVEPGPGGSGSGAAPPGPGKGW
jgi:hypothetical protein